jgi:hypothetical protein
MCSGPNIRSGVCRYMAAKKYAESIDLLQSGAVLQLKHGQVTTSITHDVRCYQTMQCTEEFSHGENYLGEKLLDNTSSVMELWKVQDLNSVEPCWFFFF